MADRGGGSEPRSNQNPTKGVAKNHFLTSSGIKPGFLFNQVYEKVKESYAKSECLQVILRLGATIEKSLSPVREEGGGTVQ